MIKIRDGQAVEAACSSAIGVNLGDRDVLGMSFQRTQGASGWRS